MSDEDKQDIIEDIKAQRAYTVYSLNNRFYPQLRKFEIYKGSKLGILFNVLCILKLTGFIWIGVSFDIDYVMLY